MNSSRLRICFLTFALLIGVQAEEKMPAPATPTSPATRTPPPQSVSPRDTEPWTPADFTALKAGLPTLIIAGDSTADKGPDAWHRGWAAPLIDYFDTTKINVVNRARGGRSSRSFVREGLWDQVVSAVKPGDVVMIQFGHNDGGDVKAANGRPDLPGTGGETQDITRPDNTVETVHTFGWYIRKFVRDVRAKGGAPVLMSTTVYNRWTEGHHAHKPGNIFTWAKQIADEEKVPFLDHGALISARYDQLGEANVKPFFAADPLHTTTHGAVVNAELFVAGARALDLKTITAALNEKGRSIPAASLTTGVK